MSANEWLAQDMADMLMVEVERPAFRGTTALGAAMLAGWAAACSARSTRPARCAAPSTATARAIWGPARDDRLRRWQRALAAVTGEADKLDASERNRITH
jgi:glycerol kinase